VRGVDLGYDRVLRLLVPPSGVARLGAEALLLRAFARLEDGERLGAREAEWSHFSIFFVWINPSTFSVPSKSPTPSPGVALVTG
jgi:hypothetical protein